MKTAVSQVIRRPAAVVRQQYLDIAHHAQARVHPNITFRVQTQTEREVFYQLEQRVLWFRLVDEYVSRWMPDGSVIGDVLSGSNAGMRSVITFETLDAQTTRTTLTLHMPLPGLLRWLTPIIRFATRRALHRAMTEDRRDLEDGGYPLSDALE